jgi:hypothetical protein
LIQREILQLHPFFEWKNITTIPKSKHFFRPKVYGEIFAKNTFSFSFQHRGYQQLKKSRKETLQETVMNYKLVSILRTTFTGSNLYHD